MKRIIIKDNVLEFRDFDKDIQSEDEVEVVVDGEVKKLKVKKTELFNAEIFRLFKHQPHSLEFGKSGNRHKIYYYSLDQGLQKIDDARKIQDKKDRLFPEANKDKPKT